MNYNSLARKLVFILLMLLTSIVYALPPQSINYQAYLRDSGGQPLNTTKNMTFRIYDVDVGGAMLWSDTKSVTVSNGLLSIKLGSETNPLPKNELNKQLWLGVEIETDGEAAPRNALASVTNAMHAENADTLDGMNADDIINATQGTPISSLPFFITHPGHYYLAGNIFGGGGIMVLANDVTINLRGYTIDGNNLNSYGIDISSANNVRIFNGTIKHFSQAGIAGLYGGIGSNSVISNMTISENGGSGIFIDTGSSRITNCIIEYNSGGGVTVGSASTVSGNTFIGNNGNYTIFAVDNAVIENNQLKENYTISDSIHAGASSTITQNSIYVDGSNVAISAYSGSTIRGNSIFLFNGFTAIRVDMTSIVSENIIDQSNANVLIEAGSGAYISGNVLSGAGSISVAIYVYGVGGIIKENIINGEFSGVTTGIDSFGSNKISDNAISGANTGIEVRLNSLVENNRIYNSDTGIKVVGNANVLKENQLTGGNDGINFTSAGNFYKNNTAAGYTTGFNLNGLTQVDGGGNISF